MTTPLRALVLAGAVAVGGAGCGPLLFPAPTPSTEPPVAGVTTLDLGPERPDEDAAHALWVSPAEGRAVVVFFHGNATDVDRSVFLAAALSQDGIGSLLVEYPGYGRAAGSPSEGAIERSATRALRGLRELGVPRERTVLVGQSLGSAVALSMATRGFGARLLLISPFTSTVDIVDGLVPFGLGGVFVRDRFDSLSRARRVPIPTVIAQGDADWIVPEAMARELEARIPSARYERFEGAGHNDMFEREHGRLLALIRELASLPAQSRVSPTGVTKSGTSE